MTRKSPLRISARIDAETEQRIEELLKLTGKNVTELVRIALERYYIETVGAGQGAYRTIEESGFIGCESGDVMLSANYKEVLRKHWGKKG